MHYYKYTFIRLDDKCIGRHAKLTYHNGYTPGTPPDRCSIGARLSLRNGTDMVEAGSHDQTPPPFLKKNMKKM